MTERESFNKNTVEVDGIRFEIFVSKRVVVVPMPSKPKSNHDTSVKLYVRITNNRSNSYCFSFHHNFVPEIIAADGQNINAGYQADGIGYPHVFDFHLIKPGKSVMVFPSARIGWDLKHHNQKKREQNLLLSLPFTGRESLGFPLRDVGDYSIRLKYEVTNESVQYYHYLINEEWSRLYNDDRPNYCSDEEILYYHYLMEEEWFNAMWTGQVFTPYVEFCVVDTQS